MNLNLRTILVEGENHIKRIFYVSHRNAMSFIFPSHPYTYAHKIKTKNKPQGFETHVLGTTGFRMPAASMLLNTGSHTFHWLHWGCTVFEKLGILDRYTGWQYLIPRDHERFLR